MVAHTGMNTMARSVVVEVEDYPSADACMVTREVNPSGSEFEVRSRAAQSYPSSEQGLQ